MSPLLPRIPRSTSDHSDLSMKPHHRVINSHLNISSFTDRLKPVTSNLSAPDWMDHCSPDVLGSYSPCSPRSPRSSRFSFSPCRPLSPVCPYSPDLPHSPQPLRPTALRTAACSHCEGCPWMMDLLRGGLSWMGSVAELCHGAVLHTKELLVAEWGCLSLVKKDCGGRRTLEEVIAPTPLGCLSEGNICSNAHMELVKGIMGCVLATESPVNLRDASEVKTHLGTLVALNCSILRACSNMPMSRHILISDLHRHQTSDFFFSVSLFSRVC